MARQCSNEEMLASRNRHAESLNFIAPSLLLRLFFSPVLNDAAQTFLNNSGWSGYTCEPLTGDASARRYFRIRKDNRTAILMDASRLPEIIAPFLQIDEHLRQLDFSAPEILARDLKDNLLLLEDFGDTTFAHLIDNGRKSEDLFRLATDVLISLHQNAKAVPECLREYSTEKMVEDVSLYLESHPISDTGKKVFKQVWREVLPVAHEVPSSLLLRDYHVANLMLLSNRNGVRRAGLLDFQDAYRGPVTYDLVSLLEDARRDVSVELKKKMFVHYLAHFPGSNRHAFETSAAILAALRHTRVLAIFEKLSHEGKPDYKKLHLPRVERLLNEALENRVLGNLKNWFNRYAR